MTYTPPDVHRVRTHPNGIVAPAVRLGHVDRDGVYRMPDGQIVGRGIVQPDGSILTGGPGPGDAADPAGSAERLKHAVDAEHQAAYDAEQAVT